MWLKKIKKNKAFSIIEVMVSVGVVSVGMLGVVSLMMQNIQVQIVNKNNLIASMLAQEGIELIRHFRDTNWLDSAAPSFSSGIPSVSTVDRGGIYSAVGLDFGNSATDLKTDDGGFYMHNGTASTMFKRLVYVTVSDDGDYMDVKSIVRWSKNNNNHDYVAETLLYDWR